MNIANEWKIARKLSNWGIEVTLQEICQPIQSDLEKFEIQFKQTLNSNVKLLNDVVEYIVANKGKRLRPILIFLIANIVGNPSPDTLKSAILVEMLHTATLLHDDVVDESALRRGEPTVNTTWQNKVAILSGDFLFATVLQNLVQIGKVQIFNILSIVTQRMSEGELLQIERSQDYTMDESIYFQMISDKTASLIAATCQLGALTTDPPADAETIEELRLLGEYLGIAFQIKDDLLDYFGNESKTGKPIGNDIIENKITLPLFYALKNIDETKRKYIIQLFENGKTAEQVHQIQDFVRANGGLEYAEKKADQYIRRSFDILNRFPDSAYKTSLNALTQFITQREK